MPYRHVARTTLALAVAALVLAACSSGGGDGAPASGPNVGTLRVSVDPSDATVTASREGTSDVARRGSGDLELDAGTYTVRASADGYRSTSTTARVRAGETTETELSLEPEGGSSPSPPEDPDGPDAPEDMQYRGEWYWLLQFQASGIQFEGLLSVAEPIPGNDSFTEAEGGAWSWCVLGIESCGAPDGLGFIATYEGQDLVAAFSDQEEGVKAVLFDDDGRVGRLEDGTPVIDGEGAWFFDEDSTGAVFFAMGKVAEEPIYTSSGASVSERMPLMNGHPLDVPAVGPAFDGPSSASHEAFTRGFEARLEAVRAR